MAMGVQLGRQVGLSWLLLPFRWQGPNELQAPAPGLRLPAGDQQTIPGELRPHPRPSGRPPA